MNDTALWARRLERERRARKEAETLLESKSHELYLANKALQQSHDAIAATKNYTENILRSLMPRTSNRVRTRPPRSSRPVGPQSRSSRHLAIL